MRLIRAIGLAFYTVLPSDGVGTLVADGARYSWFPGISGHRATSLRQPGGVGVRKGARLLRDSVALRAAHIRAGAGGRRARHGSLRTGLLLARPGPLHRAHRHEAVARDPQEPQVAEAGRALCRDHAQALLQPRPRTS